MPRLLRSHLPDGIYQVTARGVARAPIFRDDVDRVVFLRLLGDCVSRYGWRCHVYCLMGNHYHLVLETLRTRLSDGVQRLNGVYAQRFNRRHDRSGHLFSDRFAVRVVDDEERFRNTCEYVLQNPVRARLCTTADDWPWSGSAVDRGRRRTYVRQLE